MTTSSGTERKRKPWYKRWWVWLIAVVVLFLFIGAVNSEDDAADGDAASESAETAEEQEAAPEAEPEAEASEEGEPTPEPEVATDEEVVTAFEDFFAERASDGVAAGEAVTDVSFAEGSVSVVFDPSTTGVTEEQFSELMPFDNMAEFAGVPIAFNDDEGKHLRTAVQEVETFLPDGTSLGAMTTKEIYEQSTGEELPGTE